MSFAGSLSAMYRLFLFEGLHVHKGQVFFFFFKDLHAVK